MKLALFSDIHIPGSFSVRIFFDKRICGFANSRFFRSRYRMECIPVAVSCILEEKPDLILFAGDAVSCGNPPEYETALRYLAPLVESKIPILFSPGNHDYYVGNTVCRNAFLNFYHELTGREWTPEPVVYETDELRFIVLDLTKATPPWLSCGYLSERTADFVRRYAGNGDKRPVVLLTHFPIVHRNGTSLSARRHGLIGFHQLAPAITEQKNILVLSGHIHKPVQNLNQDGFGEIVAGSLTKYHVFRMLQYRHGRFSCETRRI